MPINLRDLSLPNYTNSSERLNIFYKTLMGKRDKTSPLYYLPDDMIRSIFEEYIKTVNILFDDPSSITDSGNVMIYKWFDTRNRLDRSDDLPSRIEVDKKTGFARSFAWYKNGINTRESDKPCLVEYDKNGTLKVKSWGSNSSNTSRQTNLPWAIKLIDGKLLCIFMSKDEEEYEPSDIPQEYGW